MLDLKKEGGAAGMKAMLRVERAAKEKITDTTDTGVTRGTISTKVVEETDGVSIQCGTNQKSAVYLEYGTGLYAENGQGRTSPWLWEIKSNKWANIFGVKVGDMVLWRGSHPHPFMRPAWDENKDQVYKDLQSGLQSAIARYTK